MRSRWEGPTDDDGGRSWVAKGLGKRKSAKLCSTQLCSTETWEKKHGKKKKRVGKGAKFSFELLIIIPIEVGGEGAKARWPGGR